MPGKGDVTLKIPRQLYEKLQVIIADTGFHSVTEFVVYVLRDLVSTEAAATEAASPPAVQQKSDSTFAGGELTAEEVRLIRKRLRDLGYL
ncbi:MAG TPA: CopG family transcriptional regulator [Candidatus Binatia bacterium]|jgi:Arc/MetJ-type ribon-helix-helix transcriptional regulator|nr:CopG family transcriptional regulator [Candidatus Binatia bacterium]